ncbi:MAG: HD domain-containing protein [Calditrichaeota bacterium]|nr:HD domain-containing protein [Calditrichota bacterium]
MSEPYRGLKEYQAGETFTGFLVLRKIELRSKRDGGWFLHLELGDRSGRLTGNLWEDAEQLHRSLREGDIVKVQGKIGLFEGRRQFNIQRIRKAREDDPVVEGNLVPAIDADPAVLMDKLERVVRRLKNPHLKQLLEGFLTDETIRPAFMRAPAGKLWHHNRLGGLLEHTLSMVMLCRRLAMHYPDIDRDLLIAGAVLHDIGKVEEYSFERHFEYSDRGRLVGHIPLAVQWVGERAAAIEGFPPELLDQVQHLILSHQGGPAQGSPQEPKTREAFLLHYVDEIDSKMDAYRRLIADRLPGERWKFVELLGRHLDLGPEATGDAGPAGG